jgi:hypothetical protein
VNFLNRPTPAPAWPFGQLTPQQQKSHAEQLAALRADELRRMPTVFGGLDDVRSLSAPSSPR